MVLKAGTTQLKRLDVDFNQLGPKSLVSIAG
jgi:hypothetical protein